MSISLSTIKSYISGLTWVEGGLLSTDVLQVVQFLETNPDSSYFVGESKRCLSLLHYWSAKVASAIRRLEIQNLQNRDKLDPAARQNLVNERRQIKQRAVDAFISQHPTQTVLNENLIWYEEIQGVLSGLLAALDTSLLVQESVGIRQQEIFDNSAGR